MSKSLLATIHIFGLIIFAKCGIQPSRHLSIVDGEGFVAYLDIPNSFGAIANCWFSYQSRHLLDLNSTTPIRTYRGEFVLPFSPHTCGIRVNNLNHGSQGTWYIEAQNFKGEVHEDYVEIAILTYQNNNFETIVSREIGMGLISCLNKTDSTNCKIISDQGETWDQCQVTTTFNQNRTFDCLTFHSGQVSPTREHIVVHIKDSLRTSATIEESKNNYILRCPFDSPGSSCRAEMPDQKNELFIMEGLYNGKYSSYDTSSQDSFCALEIPKPLAPNQIGLWRIKQYEPNSLSGCIFQIGDNKTDIIENELEKIKEAKILNVYIPERITETLPEISFTLPFAIDDCYIRDPNNTVYLPESTKFQRLRSLGKCSFTGLPVLEGTWVCGARGRDYPKEIVRDIKVFVKPREGEVVVGAMELWEAEEADLMCKSSFDSPIKNCIFVDPQNRVHLVGTEYSMKTEGHVQYSGRGLHMGDCGVKIEKVKADDFGEWKCQFLVATNKQPSMFTIQLTDMITRWE